MTTQNLTPARQTTGNRSAGWQSLLAGAVRDLGQLRKRVGLPARRDPQHEHENAFGVLVPRPFIDLMRRGDERDPLLLQVMPRANENERHDGFTADPLGESSALSASASPAPRLLQKFRGRSLILTTDVCGVHCRYCFRRHLPHRDDGGAESLVQRLTPAIERIAADSSVHEVILSGGDPLTIEDSTLAELLERLGRITHIRRLRIHTRMPIVIPERVTPDLVYLLKSNCTSAMVVVQANHRNELSGPVEAALARMIDSGVSVLCQSVLLAGINDNVEALAGLCERLVDMRVMPYYLHQLDRVAGAAHFEVPVERGVELIAELRAILPGYAVPRYVREIPGAPYKRPLA